MQSLSPGWILLSRRPAATFDLPPEQVVRSFREASARLRRGSAQGLLVDAGFYGATGNAWTVVFALRERFPAAPVAVLSTVGQEEARHG